MVNVKSFTFSARRLAGADKIFIDIYIVRVYNNDKAFCGLSIFYVYIAKKVRKYFFKEVY